jgi:hypothetical protein
VVGGSWGVVSVRLKTCLYALNGSHGAPYLVYLKTADACFGLSGLGNVIACASKCIVLVPSSMSWGR